MTWNEIYKKYEDTELMKEFLTKDHVSEKVYNKKGMLEIMESYGIKDIWGYLIVFAETKGYDLRISHHYKPNGIRYCYDGSLQHQTLGVNYPESKQIKKVKQAMLWCADKFFEVGK